VHSATLGKGKSDDTLIKIRNGDLKGKGEVTMVFGKQVHVAVQILSIRRLL
jgi:carboxymethylenebutenolidase